MDKNQKIDFMGIGIGKSGTTWIAKCLNEHPEICISNPKEPHFFFNDEEYKKMLKEAVIG